jgi:dTDP-4-dehydrorhamnose 3,5-epimerase
VIFVETRVPGAFVVEPERLEDERGFFARIWCAREFAERGLDPRLVQCSISLSERKGTLRGLHYQAPPYAEAKLVRCTRGAVHDVIVDLREDSPAFLRHVAVELSAVNHRMLYVPEGVAHGFQTLEDHSEVAYQMSAFHAPSHARGVRWNDPAFGIVWPPDERIVSERDRSYPDFVPARAVRP